MKKIIAVLLLAISASASANGYRNHGYNHGGHYNRGYNYGWIAPAIIGGAVVYGLTRPYYAPPPVVIQEPPVYIQQPVPAPPYGYRQETILDNNCNCYRTVLVPN